MKTFPWMIPSVSAGIEELKKQPAKALLVFFTGGDWCQWCVALEKRLHEDEVLAGRLAQLDVISAHELLPQKGAPAHCEDGVCSLGDGNDLRKKYNLTGVPTLMLFTYSNGKLQEEGRTVYRGEMDIPSWVGSIDSRAL